jgi:hypothetical protein
MSLTDLAYVKRNNSIITTNSDFKLTSLINDQSQAFLDETGRTTFDVETYTENRDGLGNDTMQLSYWPVQSITSLTKRGIVLPVSTAWNVWGYQFDPNGKITLIHDSFNDSNVCFNRKTVIAVYVAGYPTITVTNELQTIPSGPPAIQGATWPPANTIYVLQPNWEVDGGVSYFGGAALTLVTGPPNIGQYFVMGNGGYLFNASDQGRQVTITYTAAGYPLDLVGAVSRMVMLRYKQQGHEDLKQEKIADGTTTYSKEAYPADVVRIIKKYKKFFFLPGF